MKCPDKEDYYRDNSRPPHRGAWIEIKTFYVSLRPLIVAPRTGGRGLKYKTLIQSQNDLSRPPHRGAWIEIEYFKEV